MRDKFHHEVMYRGEKIIKEMGEKQLIVCGAGAIGSNLVDNLMRQGFKKLKVIDKDRVETHNINTQIYMEEDVGALKADVLKNHIFRAVGEEIEAVGKELDERTVKKFLAGGDLIVDTFDNSAARQTVKEFCQQRSLTCLHIGLSADYGEIIWNENYRVPSDIGVDVCDYPLARNLVIFAVAVASEAILRYFALGEKKNYSFTLKDLKVNTEAWHAPLRDRPV
jgi:molybdopterin/thiamine biosynthesis adenylyltransferase